jgi:hypothetical protein
MGHYCRICGRRRPNEQFSGKGHKIHVCKRCQRLPKTQRRAIENRDEICHFMEQSHISKKNIARLEKLVKSQEPEIASLAALVLEVARVTPYKRKRLKTLARQHPDLLRKLDETGLVYACTWHPGTDSVFDETSLEEAEFFVEEGKTELPQTEDSKTTDLHTPEDWEIPF